jgi:hypothetical protein
MAPDMDRSDRKERLAARREALPADDQATILLRQPSQCPLRLAARDASCDRSATVLLGLPDPRGPLCPDTAPPELLPPPFGSLPLLRCADLETLTGACPLARAHLDRGKAGEPVHPLVPVRQRGPLRSGHAVPSGAAVAQAPCALPPSPPPCPGGQSAIHGARVPTPHAACVGQAQPPRWPGGARASHLPALHPALRGTLRPPGRPARDITPAATSQQAIEPRLQELPQRRLRHPTPALGRCRGTDSLAQAPLSSTHAFKSACHDCPPTAR